MRFGESYKTGIYLIVSIVGHRETGFPVRRSKDLLEFPDCLRRAVKIMRSERPSNRLTVDEALFSLKGLVSAVWPSMEMPSQLLTARLRNTPSVLFHMIKELWCMAVTFISMDWIILTVVLGTRLLTISSLAKNRWCQILMHFWDAGKMTTICLI